MKHSSEIIDSGELDSVVVEKRYDKIAEHIRKSESYDPECRNVITIVVERTSEIVHADKYEKSVGLYQIEKEWKKKYCTSE